jgi:hypothetical protein
MAAKSYRVHCDIIELLWRRGDRSLTETNNYIKMSIYYPEAQTTVSSARINMFGERVTLLGQDFEMIPHKSVVDVIGYLKDGVVLMNGKVTLSTPNQINVNIIKTDDKQERRSYLKVKIQLRTKLLRAYSLGRNGKSYAVNEIIETRDLSLGGVAFYSNGNFFKRQKISIDFNYIKPAFIAKAEILRKERGSFKNGYRFKYGCRFLNISSEEERVLCEFVFRTQLEGHKRLLQMQEELEQQDVR